MAQEVGGKMILSEDARASFQSMREGILIIDAQAKILFANRSYMEFLNKTEAEIIGRPLRDIRPGARLPEVLSTGQPILHAPRMEENDNVYFVNMYPIHLSGEIIGGVSVVTFLRDAYDFRAELEAYEKRSRQVLQRVNKANSARYTFDSIVAVGENVQTVKAYAQKAAATDAPVLLASESGTGKELYAQAIHNASPRRDGVFVAINCANFNANTLESELFGYVEGAFTGAKRGGKMGLFEAADGGTLFLDEVSEMDIGLQAKLLRVIQEGRFRPVGGVNELETDVRVISASNADLQGYIEDGRFRRDLFYRLSTFQIRIPPLRERRADIPVLGTTGRAMCGNCETCWRHLSTFLPTALLLLTPCRSTSSAVRSRSGGFPWPNGCRCLNAPKFKSCSSGTVAPWRVRKRRRRSLASPWPPCTISWAANNSNFLETDSQFLEPLAVPSPDRPIPTKSTARHSNYLE